MNDDPPAAGSITKGQYYLFDLPDTVITQYKDIFSRDGYIVFTGYDKNSDYAMIYCTANFENLDLEKLNTGVFTCDKNSILESKNGFYLGLHLNHYLIKMSSSLQGFKIEVLTLGNSIYPKDKFFSLGSKTMSLPQNTLASKLIINNQIFKI